MSRKIRKNFWVKLRCKTCGRFFSVKRYRKDRAKFCSPKCYAVVRDQRTGSSAPRWEGGKTTLACVTCGKEFQVFTSRIGKAKCCSVACRTAYLSLPGNNPNWKGGLVKLTCGFCHKLFSVKLHRASAARFCSLRCARYWQVAQGISDETHKKLLLASRGKNNPNWQGGRTPLHLRIRNSARNAGWRNDVFHRDNYTCQVCSSHGPHLNAHHLIPFSVLLREFLEKYKWLDPTNDKEELVKLAVGYRPFWNTGGGVTLCEDCHNKTRSSSRVLIRLAREKQKTG